jgi:hypothetical protein
MVAVVALFVKTLTFLSFQIPQEINIAREANAFPSYESLRSTMTLWSVLYPTQNRPLHGKTEFFSSEQVFFLKKS